MPSRRATVIAAGSGLISALSGCPTAVLRGPTVRDVYVGLENDDTTAQTFHFALEIDDGMLEWHSRTVDAETFQPHTLDTPSGATPIAFHGRINDSERTYEFDNLDRLDQDICLPLYFSYMSNPWDEVHLTRGTDLDCH